MKTKDARWIFSKRSKLWVPQHKRHEKSSNGFYGKSLWDWVNLLGVLAIPFVVTFIGIYLTQQITYQQVQASEEQHQTDLQIAHDQELETALKTYLDEGWS